MKLPILNGLITQQMNVAAPVVDDAPRVIPEDKLEIYEKGRSAHGGHCCNAPFNNMYFTIEGGVGCCWLTIGEEYSEKWGPGRTIRDIWFGTQFNKIREAIDRNNLHTFCKVCEANVLNGRRPLAQAYDNTYPIGKYPSMMEMEVSNLCNLECIMCNGDLSSRIRKNRERRAPLVSPYNDEFVEQMKEFIPHLSELRFNGGEPFLHKFVYKILDQVALLNPTCKVTIATNGTVFSKVVQRYFESINLNINLSLDSLTPDIYESIRVNSKFDLVTKNLEELRKLCKQYDRNMCIMVNPMRMNWHELPEFVRFANARDVHLWFNTIQRPLHLALWNLPKEELQKIYDFLKNQEFEVDENNRWHRGNVWDYFQFVDRQVRSWCDAAGGELLK